MKVPVLRSRGTRSLAVVALLALPLAGCGEDAEEPAATPSPTASATASDEVAAEGVTVEITIAGGKADPQGKRVEVGVGEPITLVVSSDEADEIHVHSDPEHSLDIAAGERDKELTFTVDRPGQVAVESHHLGVTLVQLVVKP